MSRIASPTNDTESYTLNLLCQARKLAQTFNLKNFSNFAWFGSIVTTPTTDADDTESQGALRTRWDIQS